MRDGLAWAGGVNLVGGACGALVNLVLAVVVGRMLGTDGTGQFFQAVAVFMILANIAELGADTGLVRFLAAARATGRHADLRLLLVAAVVPVLATGVVLVAAGAVAVSSLGPVIFGPGRPMPGHIVVIGAVCVAATALCAVMLAATRGLGDVISYPLLQNIALPVARLVCVAAVLGGGWSVSTAILAWMAPLPFIGVVAALLAWRLLTRETRRAGAGDRSDPAMVRRFWGFSAVRGVSAAVEILLEWVDVLIVAALASPAEAGVYAVVSRCVRAGEVVQQAARIAVGPQISSALARKDHDAARAIYGAVTSAMIGVSWPFFLLLACFGSGVLSLFGAGFSSGASAIAVLSLAFALATAAGVVQTILLMGGRSSWQLANKSVALAINIALNVVLVPIFGITGAALAWAVTIAVDTALAGWQVQRVMGISPPLLPIVRTASMALAVFGGGGLLVRTVLGADLAGLLIATVLLGAIYIPLGWRLRHALGWEQLSRRRAETLIPSGR